MYMQSMYIRRFSSFQETSDPSQALCCKTEKDQKTAEQQVLTQQMCTVWLENLTRG